MLGIEDNGGDSLCLAEDKANRRFLLLHMYLKRFSLDNFNIVSFHSFYQLKPALNYHVYITLWLSNINIKLQGFYWKQNKNKKRNLRTKEWFRWNFIAGVLAASQGGNHLDCRTASSCQLLNFSFYWTHVYMGSDLWVSPTKSYLQIYPMWLWQTKLPTQY